MIDDPDHIEWRCPDCGFTRVDLAPNDREPTCPECGGRGKRGKRRRRGKHRGMQPRDLGWRPASEVFPRF